MVQRLLFILLLCLAVVSINCGGNPWDFDEMFAENHKIRENANTILYQLAKLAEEAHEYRSTFNEELHVNAGNGSFVGFMLAQSGAWGEQNPDAKYVIVKATSDSMEVEAYSKKRLGGIIHVAIDKTGKCRVMFISGF